MENKNLWEPIESLDLKEPIESLDLKEPIGSLVLYKPKGSLILCGPIGSFYLKEPIEGLVLHEPRFERVNWKPDRYRRINYVGPFPLLCLWYFEFFFYLDVGPLVLLLFQEVAVFCARGPRRLAAVGSLRGTTSTVEEFQKERDLA